MSDDVRTRSLSDEAERLKDELVRRDLQRSQLQHREATLAHWLAEVERERDELWAENQRLRQLVALAAMPETPETGSARARA